MVLPIQPLPQALVLELQQLFADLEPVAEDAIQIPWGDMDAMNAYLEAAAIEAAAELAEHLVEIEVVGLPAVPPAPATSLE